MAASLPRFLIGFYIIAIISSCKQSPLIKRPSPATQHTIDSLITLGNELVNSHIDSLPLVSVKLSRAAQATQNKIALVYSELFMSRYYWLSGNHEQSMEVALKCLDDAGKWRVTAAYPSIYGLIGNLHKEKNNYNLAFEAQQKGMQWAIINKDTADIISALNLKSMLIHTQVELIYASSKSDTSIKVQLAALKIAATSPKFESLCIPFYDNISEYYLSNKDFEKAIYYGNKGATLALKYHRQRSLTYSYAWLGQAYYFKGDQQTGLSYLNKALQIATAINEPYRKMEIYDHFNECYDTAGNYKEAIVYSKKWRKINDSLQVNVNEKQLSELEIKYETTEKDKQILQLDRNEKVRSTQIMVVLVASLLGIVFSTILILQYRVIRRSNRLIKISNAKKDKALENIAFIQAHELRRPLASIMGIINVIKAMDYEFDPECLTQLEKAGEELDEKIHSVLAHVEKEAGQD
jgi:tetratricopeptide (TPR) repeat protein